MCMIASCHWCPWAASLTCRADLCPVCRALAGRHPLADPAAERVCADHADVETPALAEAA